MLVGPTQVFAARDGSQTEPPALNPPHVKVGQPLVSTVEMRGDNEGGGGMTGRRGRAARSFTGGVHILISLRAFDRVPRGHPRLMVTPPLTESLYCDADGSKSRLKRGVGLGHRGQYDVPHEDGGTEKGPYGSDDALMPRVRDDIGRG